MWSQFGPTKMQGNPQHKYEELLGMQISINAMQSTTNIPEFMTKHKLWEAMSQGQHLQCFMETYTRVA